MHQRLARDRDLEERVPAGGHLAEPRPEHQQRGPHRGCDGRAADLSPGRRRPRTAGGRCRRDPGSGTRRSPAAAIPPRKPKGRRRPRLQRHRRGATAADGRSRAALAKAVQVCSARATPRRAGIAARTGVSACSVSMSSGNASTTGPGRPGGRRVEGMAGGDPGRGAGRQSGPPTWRAAEHAAVIDLLERSPGGNPPRPPARRAGSGRGRPAAAVWTPMAALLAPGPRVTSAMPGLPVSLPYASAMLQAPLSCLHTTELDPRGTS